MAEGNINDLNSSAENIREVFAEISNLVDELNKNLAQTVNLTQNVTSNMSQSNDKSKEAVKYAVDREAVQKKVGKLSDEEFKKVEKALLTGKGLTKELAKQLGIEGKKGALTGTAAMMKARALGLTAEESKIEEKIIKQKQRKKLIDEAIMQLQKAALDAVITAALLADKQMTQVSKRLNVSKEEAGAMQRNMGLAAVESGHLALNTAKMINAQIGLNDQLGTSVQFSTEMAGTFALLTDVVGISAEAAGSLAFQAQQSGQSFREVEENVLGASYGLQQSAGVALDMKGVLEATGKVTGQLRAQLGNNPELIAKAVTKAKLLGLELQDIAKIGESMLDFESSIEKELEAELLTGKQLNLERARAAALAGDQITLAEELSKNVGDYSEFSKMNTLQQKSLAEAMGMSVDQMEEMLFKQETMNMNAEQLRAIGKGELADRLEQLDTEEKMNAAKEKFAQILADVATIALPIMETFGSILTFIMQTKPLLAAMVGIISALAAAAGLLALKSLKGAIATVFQSLSQIPFGLGIPLAAGAVAGLMVAFNKPKSVKDGFAPSSKGPFTITDNYGGMARTTPGDNLQVGPNTSAKAAPAPVIIQNNWDAFAASNGNGRRGLGGTQEMQASPTFA